MMKIKKVPTIFVLFTLVLFLSVSVISSDDSYLNTLQNAKSIYEQEVFSFGDLINSGEEKEIIFGPKVMLACVDEYGIETGKTVTCFSWLIISNTKYSLITGLSTFNCGCLFEKIYDPSDDPSDDPVVYNYQENPLNFSENPGDYKTCSSEINNLIN